MKITLFIMTKKGLESLQFIIDTFGAKIIDAVYMSRDKNVVKDYYDEISDLCYENSIIYYDRSEECVVNTEYVITISWRWLIDTDKKVIVFHDSFLPNYRGWAPLVNALIDKAYMVGVTAFIANGEADSGDIIEQVPVSINYPIKVHEAIDLVLPAYYKLCDFVISILLKHGKIKGIKQNHKKAFYGMWMDGFDYEIDWGWSAEKIVNFVNSVGFPYTGAISFCHSWADPITILDCEIYPNVNIINRERHIGKVIFIKDDKYVVITGDGLIKITNAFINKKSLEVKKLRVRFL